MSLVLPHDWYPAAVPDNVVLGEQSWCYSSFAFVHYRSVRACGVRVGHHTGIYAGCQFELGPDGQVEIGNYCTLVGATIVTDQRVIIGDYTFIAHDVVLADASRSVPTTVLNCGRRRRPRAHRPSLSATTSGSAHAQSC